MGVQEGDRVVTQSPQYGDSKYQNTEKVRLFGYINQIITTLKHKIIFTYDVS